MTFRLLIVPEGHEHDQDGRGRLHDAFPTVDDDITSTSCVLIDLFEPSNRRTAD